jgi:Domain of unknown function (DUF4360)
MGGVGFYIRLILLNRLFDLTFFSCFQPNPQDGHIMQPLKMTIASILLLSAISSQTLANSVITIQGISYGGSGCPSGSANVTVSPDGQKSTILFDKFAAEGHTPSKQKVSCNLAIPITVPQGFQISLDGAEYRGYVASNTAGTIRSQYFFNGQRSPVFQQTFQGETSYYKKDSLANMWSVCGNSVNLGINVSMAASGRGLATLDFSQRGLVYHLKYRTCS